jgi:hypothetical protein
MKKLFTLLALVITIITFAQAPQGFNYQATVRNSAGALIVNQNVNFKFNIMLNSATSLPIFSETHLAPTDDLGQVNLVIGTGTATTGSFSTINWGSGNYYLGIELNTGAGYVAMGTTQLLSVPYALYANSAGSSTSQGKTSIYLTGNINNAQAAEKIAAELGPNTDNVYVLNTTQLTTIDLTGLNICSLIQFRHNDNLTTVNLNNLSTIYNQAIFEYNPMLSNINLSNLSYVPGSLEIFRNQLLSSINLPSLLNGQLSIGQNPSLGSINLPVFSYSYGFNLIQNISLNNLSLPSLTNSRGSFYFWGNSFTSNTINSLLNKFLTVLPASGKTIQLNNQNPLAPPTGQGIIDKQTLINTGNDVYTD